MAGALATGGGPAAAAGPVLREASVFENHAHQHTDAGADGDGRPGTVMHEPVHRRGCIAGLGDRFPCVRHE